MNTYLLIFGLSTFSALVITPIVRRTAERRGWLDVPRDNRRVHRKAVPRLGGIAVFASVAIALATLPLFDNLVTQSISAKWPHLFATLVPATLVFLFGVYDDLKGSGARWKFLAQGLAGALLYALGANIEALSIPLVGSVELPPAASFALTVVWTVGITNAFNLIDGMDGLATGAALFAALVMLVVSLILGHPLVTVMSLALSGALIGFLRYNFNPASIFLGDSGSLFIGFLLAALSIQGAQKASTAVAVAIPLLAFGLPVLDTSFAMMRRFIGGRPLFQADREHIHHMLLDRNLSQRQVALTLYGVCALFGLLALLFVGDLAGRTTGLVLIVIGVAITLAVSHLRYHEVDEIKAYMKRNLAERRLRVANNIRIRRAARGMSRATTLGEIFDHVREMLELSEFVYSVVQLGQGGNAAHAEQVLAREGEALSSAGVKANNGLFYWTWERGDIEAAEIIGSGRFWTLRLPLSTDAAGWGYINLYRGFDSDALLLDTNYLCDHFQREMARAAERVLGGPVKEPNMHRTTAAAG